VLVACRNVKVRDSIRSITKMQYLFAQTLPFYSNYIYSFDLTSSGLKLEIFNQQEKKMPEEIFIFGQ
jgi:hypothetical protein